ncbi:MAG TPA: hypothetical protein VJI46_06195 [Candidatus Nanoarchaeia archaeon]|nr:hypothetical protein [Candidatus Nanoarchaeia archaeon]
MEPEILFLRYAFPCAFILRTRGKISARDYGRLEYAAKHGKKLPQAFLEKSFPKAIEKLRIVANGQNIWNCGTIRKYFINRHNSMIDDNLFSWKNAPSSLKELCKVKKARVMEKKGRVLVAKYGKSARPVFNLCNAKPGDYVMIHYGYAVEKA